MALSDYKLAAADFTNKDVASLADKPALTAAQLKAKFDSPAKEVIMPKYNDLIDELEADKLTYANIVTAGTEDNFVSLDADGNIQDSGSKAASFEAAGAVTTHDDDATAHDGHFTDTDNPHSVTAAQAGALPTTGGTMTAPIGIKYGASYLGKTTIFKNHSTVADFGTYIRDFKDGDVTSESIALRLCAAGTNSNPIEFLEGSTTAYKVLTTKAPVALTEGGTGATTAADARTALELGNSATLDTGTTAGTVATGNHSHTRSSLGFLSYQGEVSVGSSVNYVDVTISGLTSSYKAFAFRAGLTGTTGSAVPVGAVCSTNNCRVYFSTNGAYSTTISIFATL